jgi:hypothetical protein
MKNKLIMLAILSVLGNSTANAFELSLPAFLGGKSEAMPTITVGTTSNPITASASDTKPISQPAKVVTAAVTPPSEVNPYTGVRADAENTKIKIDAAIAEADLYEKQFEAGKRKFLFENKDKLYKKDLSEKLSLGSSGSGINSAINAPDLSGFDAQLSKSTSKKSKKQLNPLVDMARMPVAPPPPPAPQLVGVMSNGKIKSAILSMGGETATVSDGGSFAGRKVSDITDSSVTLDGKKLSLVAAVNTLTNPDKQDIGAGGKGTQPTGNPMQAIQPAIQPAENFPMPSGMPTM